MISKVQQLVPYSAKKEFSALQNSTSCFQRQLSNIHESLRNDGDSQKGVFWDGLALYVPPGGNTLRSKMVSY